MDKERHVRGILRFINFLHLSKKVYLHLFEKVFSTLLALIIYNQVIREARKMSQISNIFCRKNIKILISRQAETSQFWISLHRSVEILMSLIHAVIVLVFLSVPFVEVHAYLSIPYRLWKKNKTFELCRYTKIKY